MNLLRVSEVRILLCVFRRQQHASVVGQQREMGSVKFTSFVLTEIQGPSTQSSTFFLPHSRWNEAEFAISLSIQSPHITSSIHCRAWLDGDALGAVGT
jgi:hypothetical protein